MTISRSITENPGKPPKKKRPLSEWDAAIWDYINESNTADPLTNGGKLDCPCHRPACLTMKHQDSGKLALICDHGCTVSEIKKATGISRPTRSTRTSSHQNDRAFEIDVLNELVRQIPDNFCSIEGDFREWKGTHWERAGAKAEVTRKAVHIARKMEVRYPKTSAWNARDAAAFDAAILTKIPDWDRAQSDTLFNCRNGTIDLNTGELKSHDRHDRLQSMADVKHAAEPDPEAAETWQAFTESVLPDAGDRNFAQRFFGYSLTGWNMDHHCLFMIGVPGSGKSTLITAVMNVLGSWAVTINPAHLMHGYNGHQSSIMQYFGKRLAIVPELPKGRVNNAIINTLTGDSELAGNFMRQDYVTFRRTSKLLCVGNEMPALGTHFQDGLKRRLVIVDCPNKPEKPDALLPRKLTKPEMRTAILHWMLEGLEKFREAGFILTVPESAQERTNAEFVYQDSVGLFLTAKCRDDALKIETPGSEIHREYKEHCEAEGYRPLERTGFSREMANRGYPAKMRRIDGKVERVYERIQLV